VAVRDHLPAIVARFRAGETVQAIASDYSVSRERVRQLLAVAGETGRRGGSTSGRNVKNPDERREARAQRIYGCDYATLVEINQGTPVDGSLAASYRAQQARAKQRGIEWHLAFPEWARLWRDSGHLPARGRGKDRYVMARHGDTGPYAVGNVYFTTTGGNVSDYFAAVRERGVPDAKGRLRLPEALKESA
jgi:hypothetical protein